MQEEIIQGETIAILPSDLGQLEFYSRLGEIPQEVRSALVRAMSLKSTIVDTERQVKERQQQLAGITREQQRIRENMASVSQTSQSYTRLLSEQAQRPGNSHRKTPGRGREIETYLTNTTVG